MGGVDDEAALQLIRCVDRVMTTFVFFLVAENRYANEMREPWQLKRNLQTMETRDFVKTGRPYRDTHGS